MQEQPEEPKRRRATKAQMQKYGANPRKLWHEYGPVRERLQYLCSAFFGGDYREMAQAIGVCYRHTFRAINGHSQLTVRMAGQIVQRLGIRADWLLFGSGPVTEFSDQTLHFQHLPRIHSCYYPADLAAAVPGTYFLPPVQPDIVAPIPENYLLNFGSAARSLFAASTNRKPVLFFLASAAFTETTNKIWQQFFAQQYATMLGVTLAGACADLAYADEMPRPDINALALTAAANQAGYGETICTVGFRTQEAKARSVMATVFNAGLPVLVSAEVGEIPNHANPSARPPELGAAIGAAAYVDLLIFAEQVQNFSDGGVIVACGDCRRAVTFFLSQVRALNNPPAHKDFVFVLFQDQDHTLDDIIHSHGGRVIYLSQPTATSIAQLLQSCTDAYAGK